MSNSTEGKWGGINRRMNPADLSPGESPDTTNTHFFDGQLGLLGPRKGRSFSIRPAYNLALSNVMPYRPTGSDSPRYIVATESGALLDWDGTDRGQAWTVSAAGSQTTTAAATLTLTAPATSIAGTFAFTGAATYDATASLVAKMVDATLTWDITAECPWNVRLWFRYGVVVNGETYYLSTPFYTTTESGTGTYRATGSQVNKLAVLIPSTGSVTAVALAIGTQAAWPTVLTSGVATLTVSGFG